MDSIVKTIKKTGKKACCRLFPRQMELWERERWKKRLSWFNSLDESDYPREVARQYKEATGFDLDLEDPKRFTEKLQWRKLYDRNPIYTQLADKLAVREWVAKKIGEEYLIPLLGAWDSPDEIDFDSLPDSFVLKTNHASGTNIIVQDKSKLDIPLIREKLRANLAIPFHAFSFELHYTGIKPCIIAEEYIKPVEGESDLEDYKLYCFSGKPVFCIVISGRSTERHEDIFDNDWNALDFMGIVPLDCTEIQSTNGKEKPANWDTMLALAETLSEGFAYVRVDLYNDNGTIYFGEMTFTPASGLGVFKPDEWDYKLGAMWDITKKQVDEELVNA